MFNKQQAQRKYLSTQLSLNRQTQEQFCSPSFSFCLIISVRDVWDMMNVDVTHPGCRHCCVLLLFLCELLLLCITQLLQNVDHMHVICTLQVQVPCRAFMYHGTALLVSTYLVCERLSSSGSSSRVRRDRKT